MAGQSKAAAALAEGNGKPKEIEWHGLTLVLPAHVPGSALWDYAEIEGGKKSLGPVMNVLRAIIGDDQEDLVKAHVAEEGWDLEKTTQAVLDDEDGLFSLVMGAYGTTPGE